MSQIQPEELSVS